MHGLSEKVLLFFTTTCQFSPQRHTRVDTLQASTDAAHYLTTAAVQRSQRHWPEHAASRTQVIKLEWCKSIAASAQTSRLKAQRRAAACRHCHKPLKTLSMLVMHAAASQQDCNTLYSMYYNSQQPLEVVCRRPKLLQCCQVNFSCT